GRMAAAGWWRQVGGGRPDGGRPGGRLVADGRMAGSGGGRRVALACGFARFVGVARLGQGRSSWYQVPGLPPMWAGSAGPVGMKPALVRTFREAAFASLTAARSVRRPYRVAARLLRSLTVAVATPWPAAFSATR